MSMFRRARILPLTPTLSQGEREQSHRHQKAAIIVASGVAAVLGVLLQFAHRVRAQDAVAPSNSPLPAAAALDNQFKQEIEPFLQGRCFKCHGNGKHKGDTTLDKFDGVLSIQADRKTWEKVREQLDQGEMPPKKEPRPPQEQVKRVLAFVSQALEFSDSVGSRGPGFVPIHRLNRNEYNNTIRDLVGVDFKPADDFPADDTGYGFDNIADVLSMSPLLAEKYLAAAEQVMDKAIVTENPNKPKLYKYPSEGMSGGEMLSLGSRILYTNGEISQEHDFAAAAEYEFRVRAEADQAGDEPAKMKVKVGGEDVRTFDVPNRRGRPKVYTFRKKVTRGNQKVIFEFTNDFYDPTAKNPRRRDRNLIIDSLEIEGPLDLPPPPPTEIEKRLLFCGQVDGDSGEQFAAQIIRSFATRTFRRPATDDEVKGLVALYRGAREQGESFREGCKLALTATLVSPQFLYRIELDPPDHPRQPHTLNDYELATRLSYFIWSSMPDDRLLALAGENKLHDPIVLNAQVRRMLADRKSSAFISNFAGQWLELRNLAIANPDPEKFPEFPKLRDDMRREGELLFESVVRDDQSVLDLIDSHYTFVNERLARFYGIDGVKGDDFRRVELVGAQARRRGGVLTTAAVMTVSALPNRTSPVRRGKFILDQLLGTPPPPPPPEVPPLSDKQTDIDGASLRQRMEAHRENPSCAACHARLDPLGFALENYDAIGRWRDFDGKFPVDASADLPSGEKFSGPDGLRHLLLNHKDQFLRNLVQKLMTYSLGRGTDYHDAATVSEICNKVAQNQYRFSSLIDRIVHSDTFLKRRGKTSDESKTQTAKSD